jgi:HEAT repeats
MVIRRKLLSWMIVSLGIWEGMGFSIGQTYERDTTITGPRGRSIERKVEVQRTPGGIDRTVQVTRPGGTIERQTQVQRAAPGWGPWRGGPGPAGWARPAWIPRPVIVNPAPAIGFGLLTAPVLNFSFGGGGVGIGGGGPGGPGGAPTQPPPPPDVVALEAERLKSFFSNTRKDAAYALGKTGDPRAVPSLIHVLKYDTSRDVRVAGAIALGEIGGSEAAMALEKVAIYDHKEEVRTAASNALTRLNSRAAAAAAAGMQAGAPGAVAPPLPQGTTVMPRRENVVNGSGPQNSGESPSDFTPPPPPSPVTAAPG